MNCRRGCGACCIAPSISSPIPGMPHGKPAGVRCVQLTEMNTCAIFGKPERPSVCVTLIPSPDMCGTNNEEAFAILKLWEEATMPSEIPYSRTPISSQHPTDIVLQRQHNVAESS